ncbi:hypothetical protein GC194_00245 [bacterium]|nr:hypothetical protein [bacterium]
MINKSVLAQYIRIISLSALSISSLAILVFASISGTDTHEGGLLSIVKNLPNALPWLILVLLVLLAWKNSLLGGWLITLFGLFAVVFFNFIGPNFFIATFVATLGIVVFGALLLASTYLKNTSVARTNNSPPKG